MQRVSDTVSLVQFQCRECQKVSDTVSLVEFQCRECQTQYH